MNQRTTEEQTYSVEQIETMFLKCAEYYEKHGQNFKHNECSIPEKIESIPEKLVPLIRHVMYNGWFKNLDFMKERLKIKK